MSRSSVVVAPVLKHREHRRLAAILLRAADPRRPPPPLSAAFPELNEADASAIRRIALAGRLARGERLAGARAYRSAAGLVWGWLTDADLTVGDGHPGPHAASSPAVALDGPLPAAAPDVGWLPGNVMGFGAAASPTIIPAQLSAVDAITTACRPPAVCVVEAAAADVEAGASLGWLARTLGGLDVPLPRGFWLVAAEVHADPVLVSPAVTR